MSLSIHVNHIILQLVETCPHSQLLPSATLPQDTFCYRPVHLRTHVEQTAKTASLSSVNLTTFSQDKFHGSFLQSPRSASPTLTLNQDKLGSGASNWQVSAVG